MRFLYFVFLIGSSLVIQSTLVPLVLPFWFVAGVDLPLLIVIHVALTRGILSGMLTGALVGYLQDAMTGGVLGINAVAKIVAGYSGGFLRGKFFVRDVGHRAASVAGAVFLSILSKVAVLALFAQARPPLFSLFMVWAFLGNSLLILAIHSLLLHFEAVSGIRQEEELSLGD